MIAIIATMTMVMTSPIPGNIPLMKGVRPERLERRLSRSRSRSAQNRLSTRARAADAGLRYEHIGLVDGLRLDLGGLVLEAVATPGHTAEYVAWLPRNGETPIGVCTGGALVVGGVARADIAGAMGAEELSRAAYRSLDDRLPRPPNELPAWPTHGAGSLCSTDATGERTSTTRREKTANPLLVGDPNEDQLVSRPLGGPSGYPTYFDRLPAYNRTGPRVHGDAWPVLPALDPGAFHRAAVDRARMVDVRLITRFASRHIPGALSMELRPRFASWLGWPTDPDRPLLFDADVDTDRVELVRQCLTIGFKNLAAELAGGMAAWRAVGRPEARIQPLGARDLGDQPIRDVRQDREWRSEHIPTARHVEFGTLPRTDVAGGPIVTVCVHGRRSMNVASLLANQPGVTDGLAVYVDSARAWSAHTGCPLAEGR